MLVGNTHPLDGRLGRAGGPQGERVHDGLAAPALLREEGEVRRRARARRVQTHLREETPVTSTPTPIPSALTAVTSTLTPIPSTQRPSHPH
eukprot:1889840-Pyramimonas_sp.AAC.1